MEKKLIAFRDALMAKANSLAQETIPLRQKGSKMEQADAVKLAQLTIRSLVLCDIADIITALL